MITFLVSAALVLLMGFCIFLYLHGDPNTEDSSKYADYDCRDCAYFQKSSNILFSSSEKIEFGRCLKSGYYASTQKRWEGDNCGYVRKT